jgi:hypothetical protein
MFSKKPLISEAFYGVQSVGALASAIAGALLPLIGVKLEIL